MFYSCGREYSVICITHAQRNCIHTAYIKGFCFESTCHCPKRVLHFFQQIMHLFCHCCRHLNDMLFKEDRTAFKRRYSIQEILFDILKCIDGVPSLKEMFRMLKMSAALCDSWNSPMLLQWNDLHDVPLVSICFLHVEDLCKEQHCTSF